MSKTQAKPQFYNWKTWANRGPIQRRINRKGQRRLMDRLTKRDREEQS